MHAAAGPTHIKLPVGAVDFADVIEQNQYFVDKSAWLEDIAGLEKVAFITRPRRFGKTLLMSMVRRFFEMNYDKPEDRSRAQRLFSNLAIARNAAFCQEHMARWPMVVLSFREVAGTDFSAALRVLADRMADEVDRLGFLLTSERVSERVKQQLRALLDWDRLDATARVSVLKASLLNLERALCMHCGKKVWVLIDEYDVPLQKAREMGYSRDMLDVMSGMFGLGIKDAQPLQQALLTGCLRLAKESIFTGTNNFWSYGTTDRALSAICGFTQQETLGFLARVNRISRGREPPSSSTREQGRMAFWKGV